MLRVAGLERTAHPPKRFLLHYYQHCLNSHTLYKRTQLDLELATARAKRLGSTIMELEKVVAKIVDRVLSIIPGKRLPDEGHIKFGKNTSVLKFDQHRTVLASNATLKETLADHGDLGLYR